MTSPRLWAWLRLLGGAAILIWLVRLVGTGPFLDGLRHTSGWALLAAVVITAGTTAASAWRWRLVAARFGIELDRRSAVTSYYRSQFLNATLPGGILGDVHRAVRHGRDSGELGASLRAVWWERVAGQCVQVVLAIAAIVGLHARAGRPTPWLAALAALGLLGLVCALRPGWTGIVVASLAATCGYVAMVLIAAAVAGVTAPFWQLISVALVMLVGSAIPLNVAGWGPREGAAAWAFATIGVGVDLGVTVSVGYGVMTLVASLPGLAVLLTHRTRRLDQTREVAHG